MRYSSFVVAGVGLLCSGPAMAQTMPSAPPAPPPSASPEMRMDERLQDLNKLRDDVNWGLPGLPRGLRPIPVHIDDVKENVDVRDSKGVVIGKIDSVSKDYAVIDSPGGRIEIDIASLAKNSRGLLVNMRKSKFDALVVGTK
jgi:hypothetical protein